MRQRPTRVLAAALATGATVLTAGGVVLFPGLGSTPSTPPAQAATVQAKETFLGAGTSAAGGAISPQSCDFTGDGKPDIVTSAWMWKRDGFGSPGATYVIPNGTSSAELDDESSGIIRIEGPQSTATPSIGAFSGFSLSCAGDVNGDDIDDIIIGDYMDRRAYVVFGTKNPHNISLEYLGTDGFVIQGPQNGTSGRFGNQVAGVGDLDGDGKDDLSVIDSTANSRGGLAYLVKGRDDIATVDLTEVGATGASAAQDLIGTVSGVADRGVAYVAPAGDVNGDGRADLAVGGYVAKPKAITSDADNETTAHGMVWAVTDPSGDIALDEDFSGFTVNGPARGKDRLGMSVAAAGDIDGDGFDDLVVGADGVVSGTGGTVVVRGSDSAADVDTDPEAAAGKPTVYSRTDGKATTEDRGWWIDAAESGYAVSALKPAVKGASGTLVTGAFGTSKAWAIDTRALTSPLVKVDDIDSALVTEVSAEDKDRLGRGIGVIDSYGDAGAQMIVGADNVAKRGYVITADIPERAAAPQPSSSAEPTDGQEPSESTAPSESAEPSDSAEPTNSTGPSTSAQPTDDASSEPGESAEPSASASESTGTSAAATPSGNTTPEPGETDSDSGASGGSDADVSDDSDSSGSADSDGTGPDGSDSEGSGDADGSDDGSRLPTTGAQITAAVALGTALIAAGIIVTIAARRRQK
ncbi:hypothetical protein NQ036_14520 [Brevibacterium sp. 91QC2O2]|uniref:hypothetical protein n=1 Tax=Brevibacterium sp. 91QC2O2 TaxID=2968458 RepID=UPI00211C0E9A|nr:hypothetical protein [Brevibacterium sp. 91QC2O2]MCQ9369449.1 hypothetical protein [Brevibacterium sp. 91QC2O2]